MPNPARPLKIVLIGTLPAVYPPTCDPALDLSKCKPESISRYERERSPEAFAELALKDGARPSIFEVSPLTPSGYRFVKDVGGAVRDHRAFKLGCLAFMDEDGRRHEAKDHGGVTTQAGASEATDTWIEHVASLYGEAAIREVAKVILDRAEAGPRALAPFSLPLGLMAPL